MTSGKIYTSISIGVLGDPADKKEYKGPDAMLRAVKSKKYELCKSLLSKKGDVKYKDDDGCTVLHVVAKMYSNKEIKNKVKSIPSLLLQNGADINAKNNEGNTPLHIAAKENLLELCHLFLQHKSDVTLLKLNEQNNNHQTLLDIAAANGFWKMMTWLLDNNADPNITNSEKWLPLHFAAGAGHMKCCELLLPSYTYDPQAEFTPVMLAARNGHRLCLEMMLNVQIDLNHKDSEGNTALHLAARTGFDKTLISLLGGNVKLNLSNKEGKTPLLVAVQSKHLNCVKVLCDAGADIEVKNKKKQNVLHIITTTEALECLEYLLTHEKVKKIIDEFDNDKMTPLAIAVKNGKEKLVNMLLDYNAPHIVKVGHQGQSLLHLAAHNTKADLLLRLLLYKELRINFQDKEKKTALHVAAEKGSREVCLWLLRKGAIKDATDWHGKTALHYAAMYGHCNVLKLLIKKNVNLSLQDEHKNTALHIATQKGKLTCCNDLVQANQHLLFINNKRDLTPLTIALKSQRIEIIKFFIEHLPYSCIDTMSLHVQKSLHNYTHKALTDKNREFLRIIVESKWWEVGFMSCKQEAKCIPTTTSQQSTHTQQRSLCTNFRELLKLYPHLAATVMDKCITKPEKSPGHTEYDCRLLEDNYYMEDGKSPFTPKNTLEPGVKVVITDASMWKREHPLTYMTEYKCHALLKHPLVEAWLTYKWESYAKWIAYTLLFLRVISVAIFSSFIIEMKWNTTNTTSSMNEGEMFDGDIIKDDRMVNNNTVTINTQDDDSWCHTSLLKIFVIFFLVLQSAIEINNVIKLRSEYREKVFLLTVIYLLLTACSLVPVSCGSTESSISEFWLWCGVWALVLAWFLLIYNINLLPSFCILSTLTWTFLKRFAKGFLIMAMVLLMFGLVFHVLLGSRGPFTHIMQSVVMMLVWLLGEFNYTDTFLEDPPLHSFFLSNVMLFMFICSVFTLFVQLISQPRMEESEQLYYKNATWANLLLTIDGCYITKKLYRRKVLSKISSSIELFSITKLVCMLLFRIFHHCIVDDMKYTSGLEDVQDQAEVQLKYLQKELQERKKQQQEQGKQLQELLGVCNKLMESSQKLNEQFVEIKMKLK
ncbi:hypothetical protein Pcinc_037283 [Petrolisthes cinctipes]|uniref:Transient receptor potential cation channel subfamily A member 1 n=1 Tax=Petrolisthes cinctipes TaxID=88211 RepID=A0AAE1BT47_PETCI|nr:hypothetical protein Pcinc_037283 [Petrolisthes cinctipes]